MTLYRFVVLGSAQAKGSARAFAIPVKGSKKYRAVVTSANPKLKEWERLVRIEAQSAFQKTEHAVMIEGPVVVTLRFHLVKPKSVKRAYPIVAPDLDKLVRATIDPLTAILFRDDAQVVSILARKQYAEQGSALVEVTVSELAD